MHSFVESGRSGAWWPRGFTGGFATLLLVCSVLWPWTSQGPGSALSLGELVRFATSAGGMLPAWVAIGPALLPLCALGLALGIWRGAATGWVTWSAAVVVAGVLGALWRAGGHGIGPGAVLAVVGVGLALVATRQRRMGLVAGEA